MIRLLRPLLAPAVRRALRSRFSSPDICGVLEDAFDEYEDARDLYDELRQRLPPLFYERRVAWSRVMPPGIALNASFFTTHRMVRQYLMHSFPLGDET